MPRRWQELPVDDLTGGITDYVENAQPNQSAKIENMIITRDRGLAVREGSVQWHPQPLPNNLKALQLFQLEEYIFAYTDDGDIYWTFQDATGGWNEILTAADIGADWGGDYFISSGQTLYIVPDTSIQALQPWNTIKFEVVEDVTSGAGTNRIDLSVINDATTGLDYFRFTFVHFTDNPKTFPWTQTNTQILNDFAQGKWSVFLDRVELNSPHATVTIDLVTDGTTAGTLQFETIGQTQTDYTYRPIYLNRVKPFVDSSFNGALSVSKFSGHLYLALYPDDRSWNANPSDIVSAQPDVYQIDNKRIPLRKIYLQYDENTQTTTPKCTSAQLPNVDIWAEPEDTFNAGNESNQYLYEGYARQTYTALVEGEPREFIVDGPSRIYQYLTEFSVSAANPVKVSGRILPRIQYNVEIYDLNEIEYRFFRTQINGQIPTLVTAIAGTSGLIYPNWTAVWGSLDPELESRWNTGDDDDKGLFYLINDTDRKDIAEDDSIVGNEEAYDAVTDFGYINIPQGPYYFVVSNQVGYYCDIFRLRNRVYQSIYGVPHANISISFLDFDDGITGINTFRDKAIVFTLETVWRMEGLRGLDGRGSINQRLISDEFGTVSNQSIVKTNQGLFFFARTGICYTDGYKCFRVSEQLFDTYYELIENVDYIRSFFHESQQRVYWAVRRGMKTYWVILHLRFGLSANMPITFATGLDWLQIGATEFDPTVVVDRFSPNVSHVNEFDQRIIRHSQGFINVHDTPYTTDEYPIENQQVPILYEYKSQGFSFGTKKHRKWVANVMMVMKEFAEQGVSLQPTGFNDLADTEQLLGTCFNYGAMKWGDPVQHWNNPNASWNAFKQVNFRRMFPEGSIRATFKQFGIKSLYVHAFDDKDFGKGTYVSTVNGNVFQTYVNLPVSLPAIAARSEGFIPSVDNSGQFAIKLPSIWGQRWFPIHDVRDQGGSVDFYIESDLDQDISQTITNVDFEFGYIRIGERIGIDNYTLRYTVIGERTHGAYSNSEGGREGDGTEG